MSSGEAKPELAVNQHGATVADALNGFIGHAADGFAHDVRLDVATAYFNVGGYSLLADSLDKLSGVRLLLGAEPAPPESRRRALKREPANSHRAELRRVGDLLDSHEEALAADRDLLGFTVEADSTARRLLDWLRSGRVQVRRLEDRFLHGKAFLVATHSHGVVSGSSNFTRAGLSTNLELNLGNYTPHTVTAVAQWFDGLWGSAADYDLASIFAPRFEPHPPQLIYLRMLWERYGRELAEDDEAALPRSTIELTSFQKDGLWRARKLLDAYNGVLVADEVGLGKTYFAGKLIEEAAVERRQRVLVICPATLRDGPWEAFRQQHNLPMTLVSFDALADDPRLNRERAEHAEEAGRQPSRPLGPDLHNYALIVVDEAHNLRNPSTQRAESLRRLLAGLPPKKLVLLTATPVNNSLWDLYHLLGYFLRNDGTFAADGIRSLRDHFAEAMRQDPNDLSPQHLFDVLDAVAVRRTRSFVKKHYANDTVRIDGADHQIVFPTPRVHKVTYDLDGVLPGFFERLAAALNPDAAPDTDDAVLTLARYVPSNYRLGRDNPDAYELQLAGLLRSGLLKRFESSPWAFAKTCRRMAEGCLAFAELAELHGRVATGGAIADWASTDSDDLEQIDKYLDAHHEDLEDAAGFDVGKMVAHARRDHRLLSDFARQAQTVTRSDDPTLAALADELAGVVQQAERDGIGADDTRDRRKVLVFTYFADTVEWIVGFLEDAVVRDERLSAYRGRIAWHTGGSGHARDPALSFAPRTAAPGLDHPDLYDILVTTDVLAEGVNLQQARHIVNYDLPWNPMRLVQRHGRIDRIGSRHREVFISCVFPDRRLDELLGLEERLNRKIAQAAASIGVGEVIPDQERSLDRSFSQTRAEIERLRAEDAAIFERGGTDLGAQSGEEFRAELRRAVDDPDMHRVLQRLPWGTGSGMAAHPGGESGHVFCARVGDDPNPQFRFVGASGRVSSDTLECLWLARPADGFETPRQFDDATLETAFTAWEAARADIVARWNHFADKANLEPRIPAALRQAAEIVRSNPPPSMTQHDVARAIDSLQAPYTERVTRLVRAALRPAEQPAAQAEAVLRVIDEQGLQPQPVPEPLPEITAADVHLVCWQALTV
ncbi:MAG: helicase [Acidimicrobiaceae bacterium]|nr:helicase [Acidimicrobiaceae bacterium]MYE97700.1 helicase [Acidimicrobiaceae bacterium]MYI53236.1 helicase [Acidimicrobiaceae bacterium]